MIRLFDRSHTSQPSTGYILVLNIPSDVLELSDLTPEYSHATQTTVVLSSLPNEIITRIFKASTILDRINLALTCKHLASFAPVPGVLNLNPDEGPDTDRTLIKHDTFLPLRVEHYSGIEHTTPAVWEGSSASLLHVLTFDERRY